MTKGIISHQLPSSPPKAAGRTIIQSAALASLLETHTSFLQLPSLPCIPGGKRFFYFSLAPGHVLPELLPILAFSSPEVTNLTGQIKVKRSSKCDWTSKQVACILTAGYGHVKVNHIQLSKDLNSNQRKQISVIMS